MDIQFSNVLDSIDAIGIEKHRIDLFKNANFYINSKFKLESISQLKGSFAHKPNIIVSAGPSLHKEGTLDQLMQADRSSFNLICIDASLFRLLQNGLIPDYCVVLDPHPTRMLRWFGDPGLHEREVDEYFKKQDMEIVFRDTSAKFNEEVIELVNKFGNQINLVTSACIAPDLFCRLINIGFKKYYGFTPLVDDPSDGQSITRELFNLTKLACLNTGGNVGCCAWVFTQFIGLSKRTGAIGYDYSYYSGFPYEDTQTYAELNTFCDGVDIEKLFIHSTSRDGRIFYQDPTFYWYCDNFLTLLANSDQPLYNMTNAGLLYGQNVEHSTIKEFLNV